jgi:hypothetical protein
LYVFINFVLAGTLHFLSIVLNFVVCSKKNEKNEKKKKLALIKYNVNQFEGEMFNLLRNCKLGMSIY